MARQSRDSGVTDNLVLVRAARQLLTLHGPREARRGTKMSELAIIPDGALIIRNGRIEEVGTARRIERLKAARDAVEVDASGMVVLPAFIDTATRLFDCELKRMALEKSAKAILSGMVRHGIATVEVLNSCDMRVLRICAGMQGRPATLIPTAVLSPGTDATFLEAAFRLRLIRSATVAVEREGATSASMSDFLNQAEALGLHTVIRAAAGCAEKAAFLAFATKPVAFAFAGDLPAISIAALARSDMVVTCDQARLLIDEGGALALGAHYDRENNPDYNMPHRLSTLCRDLAVTAAEAITASTVNAAYAAGCAYDSGTLEPGKWADLVLYDCRDYQDIFRHGTLDLVMRVVRHGKTVYRRGRVEGE